MRWWDFDGYQVRSTREGDHVALSLDGTSFVLRKDGVATIQGSGSGVAISELWVSGTELGQCCYPLMISPWLALFKTPSVFGTSPAQFPSPSRPSLTTPDTSNPPRLNPPLSPHRLTTDRPSSGRLITHRRIRFRFRIRQVYQLASKRWDRHPERFG